MPREKSRGVIILGMSSFVGSSRKWRQAWDENWHQEDLQKVQIAVAYCTLRGAQEVCRIWEKRKPRLELLVGLNDGVTDVDAQKFLFEWAQSEKQIEIRSELQSGGRFHPKVYAFTFAIKVRVLVGSVNLTRGAFERNTEASFHLSLSHFEQHEVLSALKSWWQHAKPLIHPDDFKAQVERVGIKKMLIELMRRGVFVQIEALLEPSREQFGRDVFDLGRLPNFQSPSIKVETSRRQTISLLSPLLYKKLEAHRKKAHENSASFSLRCGGNQFISATVFKTWKEKHERINKEFVATLEPFRSKDGRDKERAELETRLKKETADLIKEAQRTEPRRQLKQEEFERLIKSALEHFDARAPHFPQTVRLNLQISRQPLPSLLGTQDLNPPAHELFDRKGADWEEIPLVDSSFEVELKRFAEANEEQILRQWMQSLVSSRRIIFEGFDAAQQPKGDPKQSSERKKVAEQLRPVDFVGDPLINKAISAFANPHHSQAELRQIRNQSHEEWTQSTKWYDEEMPFESVLEQFATFVGWK